MTQFREWPKIARLNREMVITEKIDGTNGCVIIEAIWGEDEKITGYRVTAQSRSRIISPQEDNHGFAKWVQANSETLIADLGEGYHFGEWAGGGIGKRYPGFEKRFWLFNTSRWSDSLFSTPALTTVPVLITQRFDTDVIRWWVDTLEENGSYAYPGCKAEGVVAFHKAANFMFKATIEKDDEWKGKQ